MQTGAAYAIMHPMRLLANLTLGIALLAVATAAAAALESGDTFQQWAVQCEAPEGSPHSRCHIYQNLIQKEIGKRVLRISVGYSQQTGESLIILDLPLGIWLPEGVQLQIDDHEPKRMPIQICLPGGCRASATLDAAMIERLREGAQLAVTVYSADREPVTIPVELAGFGPAFAALSR